MASQEQIQQVFAQFGNLRPAQIEYAESVDRFLGGDGTIMLAEASTGIGKTFGYLVPLALHCAATGRRAIVSTHTLALLRQITQHEAGRVLDATRDASGQTVSIVGRLGLRNFISKSRASAIMAARVADRSLDPNDRALFRSLVSFADDPDSSGLIQDWLDANETLPSGVMPSDICVLPLTPATEKQKHKAQADAEATITVQTHALTLLQALRGECPADIVVFDEADGLPAAAAAMAEENVHANDLQQVADCSLRTAAALALVAALDAFQDWALSIRPDTDDHVLVDGLSASNGATAHATSLAAALKAVEDETGDLDLKVEARDLRYQLQRFARVKAGNPYVGAAITWKLGGSLPSFRVLRLNPARMLSRLWRTAGVGKILFTSATLDAPSDSPSHDYAALRRQVGIRTEDRIRHAATFEQDQFGQMSFCLCDRAIPEPSTEGRDGMVASDSDWLDYVAGMIAAARQEGGRVLALTNSYADADAVGQRLAGVSVHHRGDQLLPYLEAFSADPAAVLLTPAAWAGVDLPGLVRHLVLTRIPFAPPDDARQYLLSQLLQSRGYGEAAARGMLMAENRAQAKRRMRQGIGRGIRKPDDEVKVWIADPRFPLPDDIVRDIRRGMDQGAAEKYGDFVAVIPRRFRQGMRANWPMARIFSMVEATKTTAA